MLPPTIGSAPRFQLSRAIEGSQSGHCSRLLNLASPPWVFSWIVEVTKCCLSRRCLGSRPAPTSRKNKMPITGMKITARTQAIADDGFRLAET